MFLLFLFTAVESVNSQRTSDNKENDKYCKSMANQNSE